MEKDNRTKKWNTKFRGKFLGHASKNIDMEACERLNIDIEKVIKGAIIGSAFLYDVKEYKHQEEFNKDKQIHTCLTKLSPIVKVSFHSQEF